MRRMRLGPFLIFCLGAVLLLRWSASAQADPGNGNCISCHGVASVLTTTPANGGTLKFGNNGFTLVGETSTATLTVRNTATNNRAGFDGRFPAASGEFTPTNQLVLTTQYQGYLCVNRNATANRTYSYTPLARGEDKLAVTVTTLHGFTGTLPTSTITLQGQGVAPVVSLDSSKADAGNVRIGGTGTATLKVANIGDGNLAGANKGNLTGNMAAGSGRFTGAGGSFSLPDTGSQFFDYSFSPN